jgi:hypothetical protein
VALEGPARELLDDPRVSELYLGGAPQIEPALALASQSDQPGHTTRREERT